MAGKGQEPCVSLRHSAYVTLLKLTDVVARKAKQDAETTTFGIMRQELLAPDNSAARIQELLAGIGMFANFSD